MNPSCVVDIQSSHEIVALIREKSVGNLSQCPAFAHNSLRTVFCFRTGARCSIEAAADRSRNH
jgi:hypothetical protein